MRALWRLVLTLLAVAALGAGAWYVFFHSSSLQTPSAPQPPYATPALTKEYKNSTYNFSLMMPADFAVQEMPADENGLHTIVLQNTSGDGVQISVSPFDEDIHTLTKERIMQDVPDLTITNEQPVMIGEGDTGLAFKSDNEAFGGDSREVWFVFRDTLYQISTYARLDPLLKAIFATWKFF